MIGIVYRYVGPDGKCYVGQTRNEKQRRYLQRYQVKKGVINKFCDAIRKYGWDRFVYERQFIIESDDLKYIKEKLDFMERYYIRKYDSINNGYNMVYGKGTIQGRVRTEEERKKHHDAMVGRKLTEDHKQKLSESNKGKHSYLKDCHFEVGTIKRSEETKKKLSEANKGKTPWNKGKNISDEQKQKIRESITQWHQSRKSK